MARKQIIIYTDDLTGDESTDISTVSFSLNGASYEIDLTPKNTDKLTKALEPFISAGRKIGSTRRASSGSSSKNSDAAKIREWATAEGHEVPARGRIPKAVADAYAAAH